MYDEISDELSDLYARAVAYGGYVEGTDSQTGDTEIAFECEVDRADFIRDWGMEKVFKMPYLVGGPYPYRVFVELVG
jgi:hypothetical protein